MAAGRTLSCQLSDVVQGPKQLFLAAISPSCEARQSRMREGPVVSSECMAAATVGFTPAFDGLKTKARSSLEPSPLTSPFTIGVYGAPESNCATAVTST